MTRSRLVPVLLSAVLLVGAANLGAYAASGGPLLLGKSNTASKTTTLKTTGNKAALSLKSKAGKAPLKVSNSTKVTKLNADLVDGLEGDALKTQTYVYDLTAVNATGVFVQFALPGLPAGKYVVNFALGADTTGGTTLVGCFVGSGSGAGLGINAVAVGVDNGGGVFFVNGGGYVDTTTATHRFVCQRSGGTAMTVPLSSQHPARIVFTRVDDATVAATSGVNSASPRGIAP